MDDVLFWIGRGIGVMENEINHVRMKIVSTLIFDFVGFTKEGNALIYHSHLMEINRLHMKRAVVTNGYTSSEFAKYGRFLKKTVREQRNEQILLEKSIASFPSQKKLRRMQKANLLDKLLYRDNRISFILLWSLLESKRFDKQDGDFSKWSIPCLEMEVNHVRLFRVLSSREIYYEDDETKRSHTDTYTLFETTLTMLTFREARVQLERHFVLIDTILHLGFRKRRTYSAKVFVPKLDSDQTGWLERRRVHFLRTNIPQPKQFPGVDGEDPFNQ